MFCSSDSWDSAICRSEPVLVGLSSHHSTRCTAAPENADLCQLVALVRSEVLTHEQASRRCFP